MFSLKIIKHVGVKVSFKICTHIRQAYLIIYSLLILSCK